MTEESREEFATIYVKASGLPIPASYLHNEDNSAFGIYFRQELIGGFILGKQFQLRTIELFATPDEQPQLRKQMNRTGAYTEICCFWIKRAVQKKTKINFFVWLSMSYALLRHSTRHIVFGTCSASLARLYSATPRVVLLNRSVVNNKNTFIFTADRRFALLGIVEILIHKLKRTLHLYSQPGKSFKMRY